MIALILKIIINHLKVKVEKIFHLWNKIPQNIKIEEDH